MTKPLFEVFRTVMMDIADGSRKEQQDAFVDRMAADPEYMALLARDYFERMAAVWTVRIDAPGSKAFVRTEVSADKIERQSHPRPSVTLVRRTQEEAATRTATAFDAMRAKVRESIRQVVLLDLPLPNGKALRNATGAEGAKAGGFYSAVAKSIKPTQVVDRHLTEADLQNIRARYYQANKDAAA